MKKSRCDRLLFSKRSQQHKAADSDGKLHEQPQRLRHKLGDLTFFFPTNRSCWTDEKTYQDRFSEFIHFIYTNPYTLLSFICILFIIYSNSIVCIY